VREVFRGSVARVLLVRFAHRAAPLHLGPWLDPIYIQRRLQPLRRQQPRSEWYYRTHRRLQFGCTLQRSRWRRRHRWSHVHPENGGAAVDASREHSLLAKPGIEVHRLTSLELRDAHADQAGHDLESKGV